MISIIISSYNSDYYNQLKNNIEQTIGEFVEYELVQIWNPNKMSICKAYNMGAEKAKYSNLLFLHEDLVFTTSNWGEKLLKHLETPNVGVLGVAGSKYKSRFASSWSIFSEFNILSIIQEYKFSDKPAEYQSVGSSNSFENRIEAVVIDGVFLACKKDIWLQYKFDDQLLKGFHGYDMDFTLSVGQEYKNFVVFDIILKHFSEGKQDLNWFKDSNKIAVKHKKILPQTTENLTRIEIENIEKKTYKKYIRQCKKFKFSMSKTIISTLSIIGWNNLFSKRIMKLSLMNFRKFYFE